MIGGIIIILSGLYLIYLGLSGNNVLLISSSYFNFNFVSGIVILIGGMMILFFRSKIKISISDFFIFILLIFLIILFPVQPLSSFTASNRTVNFASIGDVESDVPLWRRDPRTLSVADWVRLKQTDSNINRFAGQEALIQGFLFRSPAIMFSESNYLVGKFVITCCAVDASPLGVEVEKEGKNNEDLFAELVESDWVSVEGTWRVQKRDSEEFLVLEPSIVNKIPVPANPYE